MLPLGSRSSNPRAVSRRFAVLDKRTFDGRSFLARIVS
jgi:hypothetical protein